MRFRWLDWTLLAALALLAAFIGWRVSDALHYQWNWGVVPRYILRTDEETGRLVPNLILHGLLATIRISLLSAGPAMLLGVTIALCRLSGRLPLALLARTYVELLRNLPPLVVVFIFYFFLSEQIIPILGIEDWARSIARGPNADAWAFLFGDMRQFPALASGVIVLALFESAFVAEALRAGIQSVERGQWEAASALGLPNHARMRLVILPQAIRRALPPLANQFISLVKDSSIVSLISIQELTYMTIATVATSGAIFEAWLATAGFYFVICWMLSLAFRRLERHGAAMEPVARRPRGRVAGAPRMAAEGP